MKKSKLFIICLVIFFASTTFISCGLTDNMTDQEAYEFGYKLGSSIRSAIDN